MTFASGDKCFAKVKGFPHWPARINGLPDDVKIPKGKYPIFFYGTHEVCFLSSNAIFPYEKYKSKFSVARNTVGFNNGLQELENNSTIYQYGIDPKAVKFLSQFYTFSIPKKRRHKSKSSNNKSSTSNDENLDTLEHDIKMELISNDECPALKLEAVDTATSPPTESDLIGQVEQNNEFKNPNEYIKLNAQQESFPMTINNNISNITATSNTVHRKKSNVIKCQTDEYANDFTNLLLEIRKYSWSKTKISDIKRLMKKNKTDSRVRLFFPWYQYLTKK